MYISYQSCQFEAGGGTLEEIRRQKVNKRTREIERELLLDMRKHSRKCRVQTVNAVTEYLRGFFKKNDVPITGRQR